MATDTVIQFPGAQRTPQGHRRAEERTLRADARDELVALRAEGIEFADAVIQANGELVKGYVYGQPMTIQQVSVRLQMLAAQHKARLFSSCECSCHSPTADVTRYTPGYCGSCAFAHKRAA